MEPKCVICGGSATRHPYICPEQHDYVCWECCKQCRYYRYNPGLQWCFRPMAPDPNYEKLKELESNVFWRRMNYNAECRELQRLRRYNCRAERILAQKHHIRVALAYYEAAEKELERYKNGRMEDDRENECCMHQDTEARAEASADDEHMPQLYYTQSRKAGASVGI